MIKCISIHKYSLTVLADWVLSVGPLMYKGPEDDENAEDDE